MPPRKTLSRDQVARKQEQAVRFLRDVVGNDELADDIESLSVEEYSEKKRIALSNPARSRGGGEATVAQKPSREELLEENDELWDAVENVYDQLGDLLGVEEEEEDEEGGNGN
jgi:hypothetical protein